jgi:cytochrome c
MKAVVTAFAAASMLVCGGAVLAQDVLKANGCLGCHDMEKKKVGPAYKDVAAKYKGNKDAVAMLVAKIKDGKGHPKLAKPEASLKAAVEEALAAK